MRPEKGFSTTVLRETGITPFTQNLQTSFRWWRFRPILCLWLDDSQVCLRNEARRPASLTAQHDHGRARVKKRRQKINVGESGVRTRAGGARIGSNYSTAPSKICSPDQNSISVGRSLLGRSRNDLFGAPFSPAESSIIPRSPCSSSLSISSFLTRSKAVHIYAERESHISQCALSLRKPSDRILFSPVQKKARAFQSSS